MVRCRCADFVLLNKTDMLKEGQLASLVDIAKSLNPLAKARALPCQTPPGSPPCYVLGTPPVAWQASRCKVQHSGPCAGRGWCTGGRLHPFHTGQTLPTQSLGSSEAFLMN